MSGKRLSERLECNETPESSLTTDTAVQHLAEHQQVVIQEPSEHDHIPNITIPSKSKRLLTGQYTDDKNHENQDEKSQSKKSRLQADDDAIALELTIEPKEISSRRKSAELPVGECGGIKSPHIRQEPRTGETETQSSLSISTPSVQDRIKFLFRRDSDGDTPLHIAIVHNLPLARTFIDDMVLYGKEYHSYDLDISNRLKQTALHLAVLTCQPSVVEYLVEKGADVNTVDRNGQTALHLACKNADLEDVKALRQGMIKNEKNEMDLNSRNFEGFAPIHLATLSGSCEVLGELLDMGADINVKDSTSGRTTLHHAVEAHNPIVTQFLLNHNADVNAQTFSGNTPLHTASGRKMESIIKLLLESGASVTIKNAEGDIPLPETHRLYSLAQRFTKARSKRS